MIFPAKNRSVGFDPGVAVVAFKQDTPAGKLGRVGRTYECNLESAVEVPSMWSFASGASASSAGTAQQDIHDGGQTTESDWLRKFTGTALSSIPEGAKQPPSTAQSDLPIIKQGKESSTPAPHCVSIGIQVDESSSLSSMLAIKSAELHTSRPSVGTWCPQGPGTSQSPQWFICCCGPD